VWRLLQRFRKPTIETLLRMFWQRCGFDPRCCVVFKASSAGVGRLMKR
jgi:hypothetical protein